jgi:alpha-tubulin suppressor-like RCC1 family protein
VSPAGAYHTCVLLVSGAVQCWGRNSEAQVGGGGIDVISAPTPIFQLGSSLAIAAGGYHSCALVIGGTVSCWGYNHDYEVAVLPQDAVVPPATISGVSGAVAITAGAYHSCALLSNGSADCWGYNHDGETGPSPSPFNTLAISARQVDAATGAGTQGTTAQGGYHTCAVLTAGGTVRCWGYNGHGELGNGSESGPQPVGTATAVIGLTSPVTLVAAGGYHTCAIMAGSVLCWGADESAQLGRGTSGADIPIPGTVSGVPLPPALSLDAGGYHTCAVFSGTADDVRCWGRNTEGQVGRNGTLVLDPVTTPMKLNDF